MTAHARAKIEGRYGEALNKRLASLSIWGFMKLFLRKQNVQAIGYCVAGFYPS